MMSNHVITHIATIPDRGRGKNMRVVDVVAMEVVMLCF